jgi:RNA polymerase sigma factor (sigma-70 family)
MKKQRYQKKSIREIETKKNYNGEASPYRDFMNAQQSYLSDGDTEENALANPDMLSEDDNIYRRPLSDLGKFQLEVIQETVKDLSPQQQRVLYLCGQCGLTQKETARELGITQASVNEILQRVRRIISERFIAERKKLSE